MIGLNKIGLNQVQLNQLYLNTLCACQKSSGGDGFPRLPGDVTRWSFKNLTNEQMSKNPRLEDADGKGRFLTFKNFAWSGMSGCGGYMTSKETFSYTPDIYSFNFTDPEGGLKIFDVYFQLIGLEENSGVTFNLDIIESGTAKRIKRETYTKDGIYHFEYKSEDDAVRLYMIGYNGVGEDRTTFTVKILPYYAGALVFDGVDDYGICENLPILTKEKGYTVVALRQWISMGEGASGLVSNVKNWFNDGAFVLEYNSNNATNKFVNRPVSFGNVNIEMDLPNNFTYQTSKSYKGVPITTGSFKGTNSLFVGKLNNIIGNYSNVAIWELVFLDHDATEEELTKIKDYFVKTYPWLFPDQAWTVTGKTNEDTDRATIANITGNGNNLVLSNFGFAGNSGYGEYAYNWSNISEWIGYSKNATFELTSSAIHITEAKRARSFLERKSNTGGYNKMKIKVTGIKTGEILRFFSELDPNNAIIIETDGNYSLPGSSAEYYGFRLSNSANTYPFNCDITIEQIPDYEGYLVTDGVDDKITSSAFTLGKKFTVVGEWEFLNNVNVAAGIVKPNSFFVYNAVTGTQLFLNSTTKVKNYPTKSLKAFCSDGRVYDSNWVEYLQREEQTIESSVGSLNIGINGDKYAQLVLKNIAFFNGKYLSKEDMIKAYIYLQTLKAK